MSPLDDTSTGIGRNRRPGDILAECRALVEQGVVPEDTDPESLYTNDLLDEAIG